MTNHFAKRITGIFFVFALAFAPAAAQVFGERQGYAVVVGIKSYKNIGLFGADGDAKNVYGLLKNKFKFSEHNMTLLIDNHATRTTILNALDQSALKVKEGDVFVMFFSGHGTIFPDAKSEDRDESEVIEGVLNPETGRRYFSRGNWDAALLPIDYLGNTDKKPWNNLILDDELFDKFKRITARGCFVWLIVDACHSGTIGKTLTVNETAKIKGVSPEAALGVNFLNQIPDRNAVKTTTAEQRKKEMRGLYVALTSAKDSEKSIEFYDGTRFDGLFSRKLTEALNDKNFDGSFGRLYETVKTTAKAINPNQEAQIEQRFFSGEFRDLSFPFPKLPAAKKEFKKLSPVQVIERTGGKPNQIQR